MQAFSSWFQRRASATLVAALALLALAPRAEAVPAMMNYQGYLTDTSGNPRTGTFGMTFALFANATGGTPIWTETYGVVTVNAGVFGVLLGEVTPLPWGTMLTGDVLWLETTVDGIVLTPRRPIVSVPYALRAGVADSVSSFIRKLARWSGSSQDGTDNGLLSGRSVLLVKRFADTGVRVGWNENFRVLGANTACRWEVLFNGAPCANPGPITFDKYQGGTTINHDPASVFGTCFGLPVGPVFMTFRVGPSPGFGVTDCFTGWQGVSSIEVEEVR